MEIDNTRLSKTTAHALRHAPDQYGLELDGAGWVAIDDLLNALRQCRPSWRTLTINDLQVMMARASKQRYELNDGRIRALYGHSLEQAIDRVPAKPPDVLYHGTSPRAVERIRADGIKPMSRQYVHLSTDRATARDVGSRHAAQPIVLTVRARKAHDAGVRFFLGNEDVWLAEMIPLGFVEIP